MQPGDIFEQRYRVDALLGEGAIGSVFKAYDTLLRNNVAIKTFQFKGSESDARALKSFEREAKSLSQLSHPNIVQIQRFGVADDNSPFIVMEFLEGKTLRSFLNEHGALSCDVVVQLALRIAAALLHCHAANILHRDLKPENIVVIEAQSSLDLKLIDFGLCKQQADPSSQQGTLVELSTDSRKFAGTLSYMSPEQCTGKQHLDARSDVYTFGLLLFELLTGGQPFVSDSPARLLSMQVNEPVPKILKLSPACGLPKQFDSLIEKCTQKNPEKRPASMLEIEADLKKIRDLNNSSKFDSQSSGTGVLNGHHANLARIALILVLAMFPAVIFLQEPLSDWQLKQQISSLEPRKAIDMLSRRMDELVLSNRRKDYEDLLDFSLNNAFISGWAPAHREQLFTNYYQSFLHQKIFEKAIPLEIAVLESGLERAARAKNEERAGDLSLCTKAADNLAMQSFSLSMENWRLLDKIFDAKPVPLYFAFADSLYSAAKLKSVTIERVNRHNQRSSQEAKSYLFLERIALAHKDLEVAKFALERLEMYRVKFSYTSRAVDGHCFMGIYLCGVDDFVGAEREMREVKKYLHMANLSDAEQSNLKQFEKDYESLLKRPRSDEP